ncbi:MAG: hypothetical protein AAFZ91_10805 [Pseudomonadota bacterium]
MLHERRIDICHESVRHWWNRFDPIFAGKIRTKCASTHASFHNHFNLDRHLNRRHRFKTQRDVALLEWRKLLVA